MTHVPARASRRAPRPRRLACVLAAGVLLALPASGHAQSWRIQGAWVGGHVAGGLIGVEGRQPLGSPPPLPGSGVGPIEVGTRDWMLTGMLGAGVNFAPAGSARVLPIFYVHGGVLYRTGSDVLSRVGVGGLSYIRAKAVGPALLLELAGVVDVEAGVLHTPAGWKPNVGLAVAVSFLRDILG